MTATNKMRIEQVSIDKLRGYDRNSRKHSDGQVQAIASSIRRFGFTAPILAQPDGTIIAGHGRLMAARLAGLKKVPVIRLANLGADEARAYLIADNRLAEMASWDMDILKAELVELSGLEVNPGLEAIGWSESELSKMIGSIGDPGGKSEEKSRGGKGGIGNPVISYTLVFDNEEQQARFYSFLRWLRAGQPGDTIAQKLDGYIASMGVDE